MSVIRPKLGLTFDDVLLVPRHSAVHPREVATTTRYPRCGVVSGGNSWDGIRIGTIGARTGG